MKHVRQGENTCFYKNHVRQGENICFYKNYFQWWQQRSQVATAIASRNSGRKSQQQSQVAKVPTKLFSRSGIVKKLASSFKKTQKKTDGEEETKAELIDLKKM